MCTKAVLVRYVSMSAMMAFTCAIARPAIAQGIPTASVKPAELADIVVTANRRVESLQKVPLTATSLGADALSRAQITNLQDVTLKTPSLQVIPSVNAGQVVYAIRGQLQHDTNVGVDASVATYLDDVYLGRSSAAVNNLLDVERVEVLEGPQGSLYGRNTTGGAVKIITQKPRLGIFEGFLAGSYSDGLHHSGSISNEDFVINVPVGDKFAFRVVMQNYDRQGYFTNQNTGNKLDINHSQSVRLSALFEPDDQLSILLQGDYVRSKVGSPPDTLVAVANDPTLASTVYTEVALARGLDPSVFFRVATGQASAADFATYGAALGAAAASVNTQIAAQKRDPYDNVYQDFSSIPGLNIDPRTKNWAGGVSGTVSYDFGGITLRSITAYRKQDQPVQYDVSGGIAESPLIIPSEEYSSHQFSQEFLLNGSANGDRLRWTAGAIYFTETGNENITLRTFPRLSAVFGNFSTNSNVEAKNRSYAGYGQLSFKVAEQLTATVGARYTVDKRQISGTSRVTFVDQASACSIPSVAQGAPCFLSAKASFEKFTYDGSLQYELSPSKQVYIRYGTGYRAGGISARLPNTGAFFKPETIRSIEGGFKGSWLDRRLTTNLSVFFSKSSDLQQSITPLITYNVVDDAGVTHVVQQGQALGFNVGSAKIWGASLQTTARITNALTVSGFYAYQSGRYNSAPFTYDVGAGSVTMAAFFPSRRPPNLPKHTLGISGDLDLPTIGSIAPSLHVDYAYRSKQLFPGFTGGAGDFVVQNQPVFGNSNIMNASIAFKLPNNVEFTLFAKNILGNLYYTRSTTASVATYGYPNDPASAGLSVKVPFGAAADR